MKKLIYLFLALCALSSAFADGEGVADPASQGGKKGALRKEITGTILVKNSETAAKALADWASSRGGFFLVKSSERIVLRFPSKDADSFREALKGVSEDIFDFSLIATDIQSEIIECQSGIKAREDILKRNLSYIDKANVSGTIDIEKEVTALLREIEGLKGRLNRALTERDFARAEIAFSFVGQSIPTDIPSSFDWINTMDFYSFMAEGIQ